MEGYEMILASALARTSATEVEAVPGAVYYTGADGVRMVLIAMPVED